MKLLLYPPTFLYGLITLIRNKMFDWGIIKSKKFNFPVIGVGNLNVGGSGKSPMSIYLAGLLEKDHKVAVISRGYGRESKGFQYVNYNTTYHDVGDEALQIFERFKNKIVVAVDEKRVRGIKEVVNTFDSNTIILDDAYQHRYIKPGLYILLTDYNKPYFTDYLLPLGRLREGRYAAKRAQIIVITKCPENLSQNDKNTIIKKLKLKKHQQLFFSTVEYHNQVISKEETINVEDLKNYNVLLISGIAKADNFLNFCKDKSKELTHLNYEDHHSFTHEDVEIIKNKFENISEPKIILTTEKDYMRLKYYNSLYSFVYYLPINIKIDREQDFNKLILKYSKVKDV